MPHLTICQLSEILALSNFVRRDWNSMGNYLRLDEDDSCPERHEVESSPEYRELEEVIQRLSLEALDQLVALCLLGIVEEPPTFGELLHHVQGCPPDPRPIVELFEVENLFDNLSRGLTRLGRHAPVDNGKPGAWH